MTKQQGYHKTRYNEYKNRNWLTLEYIKTRNTRYGEIKFGSVADAADALDEAQTKWLLSCRRDQEETVGSVLGRCVIDAYAIHSINDDVMEWLNRQASNAKVSTAEIIAAILTDVYNEEIDG